MSHRHDCKTGRIAGAGPETGIREKEEDLSGTNKVQVQPDSEQRACLECKTNAIKFQLS